MGIRPEAAFDRVRGQWYLRNWPPGNGHGTQMNLLRITLIDDSGGISFVSHGEALPALLKACTTDPPSTPELIGRAEEYYGGLRERIANGLAMFDERNVPGNYAAIHSALEHARPDESPIFRIVDETTREASLRPVKAGAVIFNLIDRRIITLQNGYREITRTGRGEVFDGERMTGAVYSYRLPKRWALVP